MEQPIGVAGSVVVGEEPGYVPPAWFLKPYVDVAVGTDDLPVVAFYDMTTDLVEYRRCVDPGCAQPPVAGQIEVPNDLQDLQGLTLTLGLSDLPLMVLEGASVDGPPLFYLASCADTACSKLSWAPFPNEVNPDVDFTGDGTLVMASAAIDPEQLGAQGLVIRTCADSICEQELSRVEIPVPWMYEWWDLLLDAAGTPTAVAGGEVLTVIACSDATCSSYETFVTETEHEAYLFTAAVGELPVVAYGSGTGVYAVTWPGALGQESSTVIIDPTPAEHTFAEMTSLGSGEAPLVAYLRFLDMETEAETRQLVVAECAEADCSTGTLTVVARTTDEGGLETNPAVAISPDGDTVLAFHTCPPGCSPQYINVLRCQDGCAAAFPDQIESTWKTRAGN